MVKTTPLKILLCAVGFFLVSSIEKINAQIVIGAPDLQFSQACANDSFNTFTTTFIFSPENGVDGNNQFIVELSDATGDFADASVVFTSDPGSIVVSPASVDFSLPTNTAGDGYKIRIKSTNPESTSAPSEAFAAYFKIQDSPFTINNLVMTAAYCPGGSYLLTIDNPGTGDNDSPLNYPFLTFNWYKELTPTTSVLVGQDPTLLVSEEGVYFVETNYGSCTSDSFSNRVTVMEAISGEEADATITSSLGNPFCAGEGPTTLSTSEGNSYQWFRNGNEINGATSQTYETEISGLYSVIVFLGSCEAAGSIDLQTGDFNSSLDVPATNMLEAGDTLTVTVTTEAVSPEFQWMLNDMEIPGATQATYNATEFGSYSVHITQTVGCVVTNQLSFEITEFIDLFPDVNQIPNLVSPNGDGINDTWIIPQSYISGTETEVTIISRNGEIVLKTNEYLNNWPENEPNNSSVNQIFYYIITPVDQEPKKGSITIVK